MNYMDIRLDEGLQVEEKTARLTDHELHTHDALEISVVVSGELKYKLLKREYRGEPGDIFLFRPFEPHWNLVGDEANPAEWIMVLFTPGIVNAMPLGHQLLIPFYAADLPPLIPAESPYARVIAGKAAEAAKEQRDRLPGWEARRLLLVLDVLTLIYRHCMESAAYGGPALSSENDIVTAIRHMIDHADEQLDVDSLVRLTSLRRTRFFRLFKEVTGLTPSRFLLRLRLQNAIHRLQYTSDAISDIAYDCGFGTVSYFNDCFREYVGTTPREHRKRAAERMRR